ncbi:MAG: Gfo/Idh/MocA family oxidoreductase [Planctomycetes bacterium]|nr:Gfo/Idh/MocA family oxidoreductase [Planctomycetota bacterium]
MSTLRAGLSGCGPLAAAALAALRRGADCDVVAAHDDDDRALAAWRRGFPVGVATTDYRALLATGIDFVVLAGPVGQRREQVCEAAEQAVPVLAAAPWAASTADAEAMVAACQQAELRFGVLVPGFGDPVLDQLRTMLADGWFGGLVAVHTTSGDDELLQQPPAAGDARLAAFAFDGDPVLGLLAADLHLLAWLCGRRCRRVAAVAQKGLLPLPHDRIGGTLELSGGALATCTVSRTQRGRALSIVGTDGSAHYADGALVLRGCRRREGPAFTYGAIDTTVVLAADELRRDPAPATLDPVGRFARWLGDEDGYPCPGDQALQDLRTLAALHRALQSGRSEAVAE